MKKLLFTASFVLCANLLGSSAFAAKWPIAFKVSSAPIPEIGYETTPEWDEAAEAVNAQYSIEGGFRAVIPSSTNQLLVIVQTDRTMRRIWNKMLRNRDVVQEGSTWKYVYVSELEPIPVETNYFHFGVKYLDEGASAFYPTQGRPATILSYMVRLDKNCSVAKSGVHKANPTEVIRNTKLKSAKRDGNHVIYTYSVNGGNGTSITGLSVNLAPPRTIFIVNNCQVDVWVEYKN